MADFMSAADEISIDRIMTKTVIHLIAAARPNFMKIAPLYHALKDESWCEAKLIHTGQHYDKNMSDAFFDDLGLPAPDLHLGVGSGTHGEQTAGVMVAYEKACLDVRPDWIVVVGDVNSTLACAIVGAKLCIPVAHLEAGLRSRDRTMPEEINRILTDSIADLLWTPSPDADENLITEGVPREKIDFVGNIMIDSYELLRDKIKGDETREMLGLPVAGYGVLTLHRPANVDNKETLTLIVDQILAVAQEMPLVFSVHPRTRKRLEEFNLISRLESTPQITTIKPLSYIQFMNLVQDARVVITDSGGIQEETTYLGIPCLTLRDNTERPITITQGTNKLVRSDELLVTFRKVVAGESQKGRRPHLWDGGTAARVVRSLKRRVNSEGVEFVFGSDRL